MNATRRRLDALQRAVRRNPAALGPTFALLHHLHLDGRREEALRVGRTFAQMHGGGSAAAELTRYAATHSPHRHYLHGEVVHDGTTRPNRLFVLTSGELRCLSATGDLNCQLKAGECWDLPALAGAPEHQASLVAYAGAAAVVIPQALVTRLLHALPRLAEQTDEAVRLRHVDALLPGGGPLARLPNNMGEQLRRRFEWQRFPDGARIIWKGAAARGLYLILEGTVQLDDGQRLSRGANLGTLARHANETQTATAIGAVKTLVLRPQTVEAALTLAAELAA